MKKKLSLILFLTIIAAAIASSLAPAPMAEKGNYDQLWKKVDSLQRVGLPQSALKVVDDIYNKAKADQNAPQIVKAVIHRLKFREQREENAFEKSAGEIEKEIAASKPPLKNVLQSAQAELYWFYYQRHRWEIMERSFAIGADTNDIGTWDLSRLSRKVAQLHKEALGNREILQKTPVDTYEAILEKGKNNKGIRPTLFDFLAQRAIDFYTFGDADVSQADDLYLQDRPEFLTPYKTFVNTELPKSKTTYSLQRDALVLMQDLIRFHRQSGNISALIDVDIQRIKFIDNHSNVSEKVKLKTAALEALERDFSSSPASAEATYEIAYIHHLQSSYYKPFESDNYKWEDKKALELCEKAIKAHPDSYGAGKCLELKQTIEQKSFALQLENVNAANQPFRGLLTSSNHSSMVLRIVKLNEKFPIQTLRNSAEELLKYYLKQEKVTQWVQQIENDGDYQIHRTEIKFPPLGYGQYAVIVSENEKFDDKSFTTYATDFWVSDLAYISRVSGNGTPELYVFDRNSGHPQGNVTIEVYVESYDYAKRKNDIEKVKTVTTDPSGHATIPGSDFHKQYRYIFIKGEDQLSTFQSFYAWQRSEGQEREVINTYFYTDRSIYRPGQTIYFKGIRVRSKGTERKIASGEKATVTFYDVNHQKVSELELQTNEYGSFQGTFTAPSGGLNGSMHITDGNGNHFIQVEEYKRPRFEVTFDPVKGSYKLNEPVTVTGKATSYSGTALDNATVNFRVTRSAYFPYYPWMYRSYMPDIREKEITHGEVITGADGSFSITFPATPANEVSGDYEPVYQFRVTADVTDITGETQSANTTVGVSKKSLIISADLPEKLDLQKNGQFNITTTNLNGVFEPVPVQLSISKLDHPDTYFRERKWMQADRHSMTEEEYHKLFPHDQYKNENNPAGWEKEKEMLNLSVNTKDTSKFSIRDLKKWQPGRYVIQMKVTDKFGEPVEWKSYFTVYDSKGKEIPSNELDWFTTEKSSGEPGEKAVFLIGSAAKDVKVYYEVEHRNEITHSEWITLNNEQKRIEIPIEEKHRGNFSYHLTFVKDSRIFQHHETINVPYSNKKLDISFATFRDQLQPGEKEKWKITIHGPKGDQVAAEMAASLYDASLDAFLPHAWNFEIFPYFYSSKGFNPGDCFDLTGSRVLQNVPFRQVEREHRTYDQLNWFGYYYGGYPLRGTRMGSIEMMMNSDRESSEAMEEVEVVTGGVPAQYGEVSGGALKSKSATANSTDDGLAESPPFEPSAGSGQQPQVKSRTNFNETAFFYPQLKTNEKGEVIIEFTIPEALTRWKLLGLAHTADLKSGLVTKELVTRKELMVVPNPPRFFREGDKMVLASKVTSLKDSTLLGEAEVRFFNTLTNEDITAALLGNTEAKRNFNVNSGQSAALEWKVKIPEGISAITYRVTARSGNFSDGEERMIPVLTNRMLVTESLPLPVKGSEKKNFTFEKLLNSGSSTTLRHERVTVEFTTNPAWYAIQALPYLMEYPYECAEQIFSRYYANSIASHIANSSPKIKAVFDSWKNIDKAALMSNLEKNQELKSLLLEETPWVMNAKDESERKKRVGILFDLNRMSHELQSSLRKLQEAQVSNGGWPWFKGMPESRYITQHIVTGMGHLDHLGVKEIRQDDQTYQMVRKAVLYLDNVIREDYEWLKSHNVNMKENHLSEQHIQYLYARSYFREIEIASGNKTAVDYYTDQAKKYWTSQNKYLQGMIALGLHRSGETKIPSDIIASLKEHALQSEEMGMYWKNPGGYYWYQAPIEQQALLIETFDEVAKDEKSVEEMKIWLLKQKQTQDWKTTKATTEACYALLLRGTDLLENTHKVVITLGDKKIDPSTEKDLKQEAGTGYFKKSWSGGEVTAKMGNITVSREPVSGSSANTGISWGAVYWQYFEQLDKITTHETPLQLQKQLFLEQNTDDGPVIKAISQNTHLKVGDKIKVRIELRVDRDMEFVHMKDMRASGFEPVNVLSGYRYQDGLGYYESTKDAATNFFFDYLRKGTYVFEFYLRASIAGDFSNGITTIQCMYAPEFTSHSEGVRVEIR